MSKNQDYFETDTLKAYLHEISKYPNLTVEEQKQLGRDYINGDLSAKTKLMNCNLQFVVSIAKKFQKRLESNTFLDIIQEGNIGLSRAIETYDPDKSAFTTYAHDWIFKSIYRAIQEKNSNIRLSSNLQEVKVKYFKLINDLESKGMEIPNDDKLCEILNITKQTLNNIRTSFKYVTRSLNEMINDDGKEIGDFVECNNDDYDQINNNYDNHLLLLTLKENLRPLEYYVIFYTVLHSKTLEEVGKTLKISGERVRQIQVKALERTKIIMQNIEKYQKNIIQKYGNTLKKINNNPLEPIDILKYAYAKEYLTELEAELFYLKVVLKNKYSIDDYCDRLGINKKYFETLEINLASKLNSIFKDKDKFIHYSNNVLSDLKTQIFENSRFEFKVIDFTRLKNYYADLDYEDISAMFNSEIKQLTNHEKELLKKFFCVIPNIYVDKKTVEKQVNLAIYNSKKRKNEISKKELYETLKRHKSEFSKAQILYLECYFFNIKNKSEFDSLYNKDSFIIGDIIDRLVKIHFNIYRLLENNFNKDKYLKVRDKLDKDKCEILDLFYGVNCEPITIKEISKLYNEKYEKTHGKVRDAREYAINLYCNRNSKKLIDKDIYIPYVLNPAYELTNETRKILKMYLIDNKDYKEISDATKLSRIQISNLIVDALRKLDFYRYGINQTITIITEEELEKYFEESTIDYTEERKKILRLKFLEYKTTEEISTILNIPKRTINTIISNFNKNYEIYTIKDVNIEILDIIREVDKHPSESILTDYEKEIISLYYGIKNEYNVDGIKYTPLQIANLKDTNRTAITQLCIRTINKIKLSKKGKIKAEFIYIPREEVDKLLDDPFLPITEKDKYIICSLLELREHKMKSVNELAQEFNLKDWSIKRIYQRAILNILKYQNNELEGAITFTTIKPYLKYFSKSDQLYIEEFYKNNLTYEQIAKKYNKTFNMVVTIFNRISVNIYDLVYEENVKKFDFNYYEEAIKNPKLPFYGNLELATKVFDLFFGQSFMTRKSTREINEILDLNLDVNTILRMISRLMISVEKLKIGIEKDTYNDYNKVSEYYQKHCQEMTDSKKKSYEVFLNNTMDPKKQYSGTVNNTILFDLIENNPVDFYELSSKTKMKIIDLLRNTKITLSRVIREQLMKMFGITERELMNGKEINKVYRILDKLEKLKTKEIEPAKKLTKRDGQF